MIMISDTVENYHVEIYAESPFGEMILKVDLLEPCEMNLMDDVYPSVMNGSSALSCRIGLSNAVALLERHDVPRTHPLWFLNHSDLWDRYGTDDSRCGM